MSISKAKLNKEVRGNIIVRTTWIGILSNFLIATLKLVVGFFSHSIAVQSDGINNVTDVLSSLTTLVGYKLASRDSSRTYPMGFGRIEYISGTLVGAIIIYAGFDFLWTSIDRIINPIDVTFIPLQIILLSCTIIAKIFLARYNIHQGKHAQSDALIASGQDAFSDVLYSSVIVISALVMMLTNVKIDGYIGVLVSLMILWVGIKSITDILKKMIGIHPDKELSLRLIEAVRKFPPIEGGHDLLLHDYGPLTQVGNMCLEFPTDASLSDAYNAIQDAREYIYQEFGIDFVFSISCLTDHNSEGHKVVNGLIKDVPHVISVHAVHHEKQAQMLSFHVVVDTDVKNKESLKELLEERLKEIYPHYQFFIIVEYDTIG